MGNIDTVATTRRCLIAEIVMSWRTFVVSLFPWEHRRRLFHNC